MLLEIINILSSYTITITFILIVRQAKTDHIWPLLFFLICVFLYLIIDFFPQREFLFYIFLIGPFLIPFSFWLVSKYIFSDKPISILPSVTMSIVIAIIYYSGYFIIQKGIAVNILKLAISIISFLFVLLAVYEVIKGKEEDLIHSRRQIRTILIYVISIIVLITLMAELALKNDDQEIPKLIQRFAILIFSTYILLKNAYLKDFLFISENKSVEAKDLELIELLQQKMVEDNFYKEENMTIKKLADVLNEKEYIIRKVINQQLGYRNFNDFLNYYRIGEAKDILSDPSQQKMTILEISYKVGFNSIAPFNRAFKSNTGKTPTEYRKTYISSL